MAYAGATVVVLGLLVALVVATRGSYGTACGLPDYRGWTQAQATADLSARDVEVRVVREPDATPEGVVMRQASTLCSPQVELVVSDGGPRVLAGDVPIDVRRLLGPDQTSPVRLITTGDGAAYKRDDVMVGSCRAVAAASQQTVDPQYSRHCRAGLSERLSATLAVEAGVWAGLVPGAPAPVDEAPGAPEVPADFSWSAQASVDRWQVYASVVLYPDGAGSPPPGQRYPASFRRSYHLFVREEDGLRVVAALLPPEQRPGEERPRPPVSGDEVVTLVRDLEEVVAGFGLAEAPPTP